MRFRHDSIIVLALFRRPVKQLSYAYTLRAAHGRSPFRSIGHC
jgi:hypothetical protein